MITIGSQVRPQGHTPVPNEQTYAVWCSDHYHAAASPRTQQQPALRTARGQVHTHSARRQATSAHPLPTHISLPLSAVSASRSGSFSRCVRMCTQRVVSE